MRKYLILAVLAMLAGLASAQEVTNLYAAGVSYNNAATPAIAGSALYAHALGSSTYAFTVVDALPTTFKPFTVTTNFSGGIAQKVFTVSGVNFYIPTSAGVSFTGTNTGWAWSTGAMASVKVKGNWRVLPNVRVVKSSVSNGTGYQPIVGLMFGWGQ